MVALAILFLQLCCGIATPTDAQINSVTTDQINSVQTTTTTTGTSVTGIPVDPYELS
jgi:hypothetical protein